MAGRTATIKLGWLKVLKGYDPQLMQPSSGIVEVEVDISTDKKLESFVAFVQLMNDVCITNRVLEHVNYTIPAIDKKMESNHA